MKHGTLQAYIKGGCRCDECREHRCRWQKRYLFDVSQGRARMVPAGPAQQHLRELKAGGMSWKAIRVAGGWRSRNSIDELMKRDRINPRLEARVLAIAPERDTRPTRYVAKDAARYRLQALARLGWATRALEARSTVSREALEQIRRDDVDAPIRASTDDKIAALFNELWDQRGPSERTRRWAARQGFWWPMDLDDNGMPLPPVNGTVECRVCSEVDFLRSTGASDHDIAARVGLTAKSFDKHLSRHQGRAS